MREEVRGTAVLIVNFRSTELLERNLVPLGAVAPHLEIVVVDNYSTERERLAIGALAKRHGWSLILPDGNLGFGEGMNRAAAHAIENGAQRLLLLNPDASIPLPALLELDDAVRADPLTMVAPRIVRPDGSTWFAGSDLDLVDGRTRARRKRVPGRPVLEWLTGACVMLSTELWTRIGGFDPIYFLYWEDVDLSWKVQAAGGGVSVVESAEAVHAPGGTLADLQGTRPSAARSSYYYYFNIRNRLVFAALRLDAADRRGWWRSTAAVSREILLRGGRRQFLRPVVPVGAALRGIVDGVGMVRALNAGRPIEEPALQRRLASGFRTGSKPE